MTAPARAENTQIQVTESAAIGKLPPAVQQQLELRKLANQVAGKLAELNWGKQLDHATRRSIADWGQRFGVDTTVEIYVLGGNVYLNSGFYIRKLGELIEAALVAYAYADHIENDPRLEQLGAEGEAEITRRLRQRIMYGVPENAKSAVVFRVKLHSMDREIVGVKWCGTGKLNQYNKLADPVGEEFPVETAESRAARRAVRLITSHVPKQMGDRIMQIESSAEELTKEVSAARAHAIIRNAEIDTFGKTLMAGSEEAYGLNAAAATQPREAVTVDASSHRAEPAVVAHAPVAIVDAPVPAASPAAPAAPTPARVLRGAELFPFPFKGELHGKSIGELTDAQLIEARDTAVEKVIAQGFVDATNEVLEARREAED